MKKIKFTLCLILVFFMLLGCNSDFFGPQEYVCELENVKSVQIVSLDGVVKDEYRFEESILCEIEDISVFIERLNALEHSVNWGEPSVLEIGFVVIKINYNNGDFDLIHYSAQSFYRSGKKITGYFFFEEDQFDDLIADYCPNDK